MPEMTGMGLKDAIYLLENMKLKVLYTGTGKVRVQSVPAGTKIAQGQVVSLGLQMGR
jgi:cell division protein FtsI (penicillin-binding protein 3)